MENRDKVKIIELQTKLDHFESKLDDTNQTQKEMLSTLNKEVMTTLNQILLKLVDIPQIKKDIARLEEKTSLDKQKKLIDERISHFMNSTDGERLIIKISFGSEEGSKKYKEIAKSICNNIIKDQKASRWDKFVIYGIIFACVGLIVKNQISEFIK
jgi:hypothetical protein